MLEQNLELAKHFYTLHKSSVVGRITPPIAEVWKLVIHRRVINSLVACNLSGRGEIETKVSQLPVQGSLLQQEGAASPRF